MKQRYLVCYEYGMGGRWGYVLARSREELRERFPELTVVDDEPDWVTDEMRRDWEQAVEDIDEAGPPSILTTILIERLRPGYTPPT